MDPEKALREALRAEADHIRTSVKPAQVFARAGSQRTARGLLAAMLAVALIAVGGLGIVGYLDLPPAASPSPAPQTPPVAGSPSPTVPATATPTTGDLPPSIVAALEAKLLPIGVYGEAPWHVTRWPFGDRDSLPIARIQCCNVPNTGWAFGGPTVALLDWTPEGINVSVVDFESRVERFIGEFPRSNWFFAVVDPTGATVYLQGHLSDEGSSPCPDCGDRGVIAFDVAGGDPRVVVAPRADVIGRWHLRISDTGDVLVSAIQTSPTGSGNLYEVVEAATGEVLAVVRADDLHVEAASRTHLFGSPEGLDSAGVCHPYRAAVSLLDGTEIRVPAQFDWHQTWRHECGYRMTPPAVYNLDDHRFLFDHETTDGYDVVLMDTRTGEVRSIYGWRAESTPPAERLQLFTPLAEPQYPEDGDTGALLPGHALLSEEWALLGRQASGPLGSYSTWPPEAALNIETGQVIPLWNAAAP